MMSKQFLSPWPGLDNKDCFMALDSSNVEQIKRDNPHLSNFCFHTLQPNRPKVFIIAAAILKPLPENSDTEPPKTDAAPFSISPDWTGTPYYYNIKSEKIAGYVHESFADVARYGGVNQSVMGGGVIETFGMRTTTHDSWNGNKPADINPDNGIGTLTVNAPDRPFTIADAMAIATYADFLPSAGGKLDWTPNSFYFPIGPGHDKSRRFMIGDAGFIEDTGLLPMLQRQAEKIAVFMFVGPGQTLNVGTDWCGLAKQVQDGTFNPDDFKPGDTANPQIADSIYVMYGYGYDDGTWHKSHNQVFERSEMFQLGCDFKQLKDQGLPMVVKKRQKTRANPYWGIISYWVDIVYYYNDKCPSFENQLPSDTKKDVSEGSMKGFPTDLPAGLYMSNRVVRLMAAQAEYTINYHQDKYKELVSSYER